jgi:hypothetical protein
MARWSELALNGDDVEPCVLARDEAITKLEDAQHAKADGSAVALEVERPTLRITVQDRFVDREFVPIEATDREDLRARQISEGLPIEGAQRGLPVDGIGIATDRIVFGVVGVRGEDGVEISPLERREVALEDLIDLLAGHITRYGSGATGRDGARSAGGANTKRYESAAMAAPMSGPTKYTYQLS